MVSGESSAKDLQDARKTKLENDKAEQELEEWQSPSSQALRESKRKKEAAEAERDAATAKASEIKTYLPDLSGVERGKLDSTGDPALFGSVLSLQALENAASAVVKELTVTGRWLSDNYRVMVTTNIDLVATEATFLEVKQSLDELIEAAECLVRPDVEPRRRTALLRSVALFSVLAVPALAKAAPALAKAAPAVAQAVASALPSVLSILSAHRSVSAHPIAADDEAAAVAVAAALAEADREATVIHESFSLLRESALAAKRAQLRQLKLELVGLKAELSPTPEDDDPQGVDEPDVAANDVIPSQPEVDPDREPPALDQLPASGGLSDHAAMWAAANRAARLAVVSEVLSSIESFEDALSVVPEDGSKSLYTIALLQERLHSKTDNIQHVLLVKSRAGSTQRLLDDRPLMFNDKFSTVASTGISFLLIETEFSRVLAGGSKTASQSLSGNIGGDFTVKSVNAI